MMTENLMLAIAVIGILGSLAQWLAWWLKLPSILLLLLLGIVLGKPVTGIIDPDLLFGDLLFPMVSLAVSVILFEGALTLNFSQIRGLESVVRRMVTVGMLVTWLTIALATHWLLDLPWLLSLLFGSLVVVTGPTVIVPMLRILKLNKKVSNVLRWEGIVIDPLGALLAVLVFNFIVSSQDGAAGLLDVAMDFGWIMLVGGLLGAVAGAFMGLVLRRHWLPEYLHNVFTLTLVFAVFAVSDLLAHESGLLAVTVMGMWLANSKNTPIEDILNFKESLTVLLISGLFIILAARLDLEQFLQIGWLSIVLFLVIQFVARPLKIFVSTWGSDLTLKEKVILSWIAPRGIVAAAVSALFALKLEQQGYAEASLMVSLTFMVIIGTVVFQSATAGFLAKKLGVSSAESKGILMVGSNPVAVAIAEVLNKHGFDCLLTDSHWRYIKDARMKDIKTYYGNVVSEHADHHLDLIGIGKLMAVSMNTDLNLLAAARYKNEFGVAHMFLLSNDEKPKEDNKHAISLEGKARHLFSKEVTYAKLASALAQGGQIKTTLLTEEFGHEAYLAKHGKNVIPMFGISPDGKTLRVFTRAESIEKLSTDWKIIGLIRQQEEE
ncbi:sodium/proton antiporter (CPA1 family) [Marinicella litoralis]|uniref:Sodium/proton antiporter (CPA1 family) n=2 Tax=Marinicella litoralis TaxID=644220 RepID=A0A4R6Y3N6_9GAMM|nr:sodium/proton antiporter (CPA1 family) [Marinicella litoralis]